MAPSSAPASASCSKTSPPRRPPKLSFSARRLERLAPIPLSPKAKSSPLITRADGPDDFIALGLVTAALGLKGAVRVKPLHPTEDPDSHLLSAEQLWLLMPSRLAQAPEAWLCLPVLSCGGHGADLKFQFQGIDNRDQSEQLVHGQLGVGRSALPPPADDEVYWTDLIGCSVHNQQGLPLGSVERLETNGLHDWLVVGPHWIPYVEAYVVSVDLGARQVLVDWQPDWSA